MEFSTRKQDFGDEEDEDTKEVLSSDVISVSSSFDDSCLGDEDEDKKEVAEFSSSFDDSGHDDEEDEAQSMLFNDYSFSDESKILDLRKKKTSKQWSRYILPIAWKCNWAELKVKELHSRVRKYIREIESYSQAKKCDLNKLKLEGYEGKSIPFHCYRTRIYKRQRRKQVEETTIIAA